MLSRTAIAFKIPKQNSFKIIYYTFIENVYSHSHSSSSNPGKFAVFSTRALHATRSLNACPRRGIRCGAKSSAQILVSSGKSWLHFPSASSPSSSQILAMKESNNQGQTFELLLSAAPTTAPPGQATWLSRCIQGKQRPRCWSRT